MLECHGQWNYAECLHHKHSTAALHSTVLTHAIAASCCLWQEVRWRGEVLAYTIAASHRLRRQVLAPHSLGAGAIGLAGVVATAQAHAIGRIIHRTAISELHHVVGEHAMIGFGLRAAVAIVGSLASTTSTTDDHLSPLSVLWQLIDRVGDLGLGPDSPCIHDLADEWLELTHYQRAKDTMRIGPTPINALITQIRMINTTISQIAFSILSGMAIPTKDLTTQKMI